MVKAKLGAGVAPTIEYKLRIRCRLENTGLKCLTLKVFNSEVVITLDGRGFWQMVFHIEPSTSTIMIIYRDH